MSRPTGPASRQICLEECSYIQAWKREKLARVAELERELKEAEQKVADAEKAALLGLTESIVSRIRVEDGPNGFYSRLRKEIDDCE